MLRFAKIIDAFATLADIFSFLIPFHRFCKTNSWDVDTGVLYAYACVLFCAATCISRYDNSSKYESNMRKHGLGSWCWDCGGWHIKRWYDWLSPPMSWWCWWCWCLMMMVYDDEGQYLVPITIAITDRRRVSLIGYRSPPPPDGSVPSTNCPSSGQDASQTRPNATSRHPRPTPKYSSFNSLFRTICTVWNVDLKRKLVGIH